MTPRQQAEEIKIAMVRGSWNDSLDILEGLIAERERLREALEAVEWHDNSGHGSTGSPWLQCPWCQRYKGDGHKLNCARQLALVPASGTGKEGE